MEWTLALFHNTGPQWVPKLGHVHASFIYSKLLLKFWMKYILFFLPPNDAKMLESWLHILDMVYFYLKAEINNGLV